MKLFKLNYLSALIISIPMLMYGQTIHRDKAEFVKHTNKFYSQIMKSVNAYNAVKKPVRKRFTMDFSGYNLPTSVKEFKYYWHRKPHSQGNTGTCWDFSTTSFLESEEYRIFHNKVALSEMWTTYWEYVEKAKGFVESRGKSKFGQGSESNAVTRIWKKYGVVPESDFLGLLPGQKYYDHSKMFKEMYTYLRSVKKSNAWDQKAVVDVIKSILNRYIGIPPAKVTVNGKVYTPKQYLKDYLKLNMDDYVDILSYMQKPYWKQVEYQVPDNWWHDSSYYNVPLDVYMKIIKRSIRNGYTMAIGGDVSEPGISGIEDVAMIPSFDIPAKYIDQYARQFRFSNHTTTDDHGIHLVGWMHKNGKDWYLIKDSGSTGYNGKSKGYMFYDENYVKLKMMDFMINKNAVKDILKKFK